MRTYEERGVSPHKPDVRKAVAGIDSGLYPGAFCKIVEDVWEGSNEHCLIAHADGAGTKSALAYVEYKAHGNADVFRGIAQDSIVMNLDDLLCVGATGPFLLSNTIGRNANLIPGGVIAAIIAGYEQFAHGMAQYGIKILPCGGETADLGDLVRTVVVDSVLIARMPRSSVIDCSAVRPGLAIVGLSSAGKATYESEENSGIGTNGFTSARHELLSPKYRTDYPETFAPDIYDLAYRGKFDLDSSLPSSTLTIGQALLAPTRTYAPVLKVVIEQEREGIVAVIHNSGGGQTKCLGFGSEIHYVKNNLFEVPTIFSFIRSQCGLPLREMYRVFNMGHRMEVICEPSRADSIITIAQSFRVDAKVVGYTEHRSKGTALTILQDGETTEYERADIS